MEVDSNFLEQSILFQSLKSEYFLGAIIEHVDVDYFSNKDVKTIFKLVLDFNKEYDKYPNKTEIKTIIRSDTALKSFKTVLKEFKELDTDVDIDVLLKQSEEYFREKAIIKAIKSIGEDYKENGVLDNATISKQMQEACNLTIITDIGFDYFNNIDEHIEWLQSDQEKISTGYDFIDKKLKGGFNANGRALYVVMGGTNSGKSIVLGNLAANAVRQDKVVPIISLEMDEQLYAQRMSCNFAEIPFDDLKNDAEDFKSTIEEFKSKVPESSLVLKEFPPGNLTVAGLDTYLSRLKKKGYDFDIVFLDYITLMRVMNSSGLYESGKKLAEDVRALSYKYGVSFVTPLQANRGGVDGGQPKLDNTSESMGIAHTADFIVSIWRTEDDVETNTLRMGVIKNRIGENFGTQLFELNTDYLRLIEVDEIYEEDKEDMNMQLKEQLSVLAEFEEES